MTTTLELERQRKTGEALLTGHNSNLETVVALSDDELLAAIMQLATQAGMNMEVATWLLDEAMLHSWPYFPHDAAMMAGEVPNTIFQTGSQIRHNHAGRQSAALAQLDAQQVYEIIEYPLGIPGDSWPLLDFKELPPLAVIQMVAQAYQFIYPPSEDDGLLPIEAFADLSAEEKASMERFLALERQKGRTQQKLN